MPRSRPATKIKLATLPKGELMVRHPHFTQPIFVRFPRPAVLGGREGVERFPPAAELPFADAVARQLRRLDRAHHRRGGPRARRGPPARTTCAGRWRATRRDAARTTRSPSSPRAWAGASAGEVVRPAARIRRGPSGATIAYQ